MEAKEVITCPHCNGPAGYTYLGTICSVECLVSYADLAGQQEALRTLRRAADRCLARVEHGTIEQCIQSIKWAADKQG